MESDEILYRRWIDGDEDALRILLERYRESLTVFLAGYVRDMNDAEELMLDSFAVVAAGDSRFFGRSAFKTWLFGIGRNLAYKRLRKKKPCVSALEDIPDRDENVLPEVSILNDERKRHLYMGMNALPADYRQVLFLIDIEGMDIDDVSKVMKKTRKQIYNISYRAKKALKEELIRSGFNDDRY